MEGAEWIKVKYTYSKNSLRNPFEHQLRLIMKNRTVNRYSEGGYLRIGGN
jgi:hypothetical protein